MSNRNSFLLLPLIAVLAACASSPSNDAEIVAGPQGPNVIFMQEGDRVPATAPTLAWVPATVTVEVKESGQWRDQQEIEVLKEMSWTEKVPYPDTRWEPQDVQVAATCSDYTCRSAGGKSELWNAFYSASQGRKAAALDRAVKGLGAASSTALVNAAYFGKKPRTWTDFVNELNRAGDNGIIQKSAVGAATQTYRSENLVNLGYAAENCTERQYSCNVWVNKLVSVPFTNYRDVVKKQVVERRKYTVSLLVSNAKLMSFESEKVSFLIDENGALVDKEANGTYNRYVLVSTPAAPGQLQIAVAGVQRFLRDLPANAIVRDTFEFNGGSPVFTLDFDPAYLPDADEPVSQLVLNYRLLGCQTFLGVCKKTETLKAESRPLSQSRTSITMEIPIEMKTWVEYSLVRKNSEYFSDKPTRERETSTLRRR